MVSHHFIWETHPHPPKKKTPHATALLRALHAAVAAKGQRTPAAVRFHKETQLQEVAGRAVIPEKSGLYSLYISIILIYIHILY